MCIFDPSRRFLYDSQKTCTFFIGGNPIAFVHSFSHLGHLRTNKFTDSSDVLKRRGDVVGQVNNMLCYFCKFTSFVKNRLFQCYCTSLYGCELCLLTTNEIEDFGVSWRKALRRVWCLRNTFLSYFLPILSLCSMRFAGVQLILSAFVFRMNPLLLGIFLSRLRCLPWSSLVVPWSECIILYAPL